jgi:predicted regulator of Ras-like GTPase activity (Roadblock/LC7/MglB family)
MPFEKILEDLIEMAGVVGAIMVAHDGEVVASAAAPGAPDMDLVGAHYAVVLDMIKDAGLRVDAGAGVNSIVVSTERFRQVMTVIKDGYCLVVLIERHAPSGRVLLESGKTVERIEEAMG